MQDLGSSDSYINTSARALITATVAAAAASTAVATAAEGDTATLSGLGIICRNVSFAFYEK